jgi:hypothetical protein
MCCVFHFYIPISYVYGQKSRDKRTMFRCRKGTSQYCFLLGSVIALILENVNSILYMN